MWYDELLANWQGVLIAGLSVFTIGETVIEALPSKSIKKIFSKGNTDMLGSVNHTLNQIMGSAEIIFKGFNDIKKELDIERIANKANLEQNKQLIEVVTLLISVLNVPKDLRENVHVALKKIDNVSGVLVETLEKSIEIQEKQEEKKVEIDNTIDNELDRV